MRPEPCVGAEAAEVRAFYDRYPYPPPVDDLEDYRRRWLSDQRRRADFHLFWPTTPYHDDFSILVAGCGTSQAAKYALRWPAAHVTGVDFSAIGLRHTSLLRRKYRLDNLEIHQLALEEVDQLGATFDQIVCTGVLHHLPDPDAGLRALRRVLRPEGAMHLMVYAPYGRTGIYMLQEFCRRIGLCAADGNLSDLILALKALPSSHPSTGLLRDSPDFRAEAGIADALLHPQDRAYSVPQLFEFLSKNGLRFGRWLRQAPYTLQAGLMSRLPRALRTAEIDIEAQYAAAELFRGNMTRHSAVVYRDDNPAIPQVGFRHDGWVDYVPIRMPDTLAAQEHLPPGIAAILVNRTHTHPDICLPVRPHEMHLLDAIDGTRQIGTMLAGHEERDAARAFFERLWWHDQVVFNAARSAGPPRRAFHGSRHQTFVP